VSDLLLALEDENAWTNLNLPGMLKLELRSELLGIQAKKDVAVNMQLKEQHWVRYFSKPDNAFFYCNSETFVSRWELPEGNFEIYDDNDHLMIARKLNFHQPKLIIPLWRVLWGSVEKL
jgi:hypothetical protein